jgi:isopenicillin N synthase-like dioxygenase
MNTENFACLSGHILPNDLVEKFRIGPIENTFTSIDDSMNNPNYFTTKEGKIHFFPNTWGNLNDNNINIIKNYYMKMEQLSIKLLIIIAISLQLPYNYFIQYMKYHTSILTLNNYPHLNNDILNILSYNQLRIAEHTDVSMITIVNQLYYRNINTNNIEIAVPNTTTNNTNTTNTSNNDGNNISYVEIPYVHNALIVNIGDCMKYWTSNVLKSTSHRVPLPSRNSISTSINSISSTSQSNLSSINSSMKCKDNNVNNMDVPKDNESPECKINSNTTDMKSSGEIAEQTSCSSISAHNVDVPNSCDFVTDIQEESNERMSVAYFVSPNYDAILDYRPMLHMNNNTSNTHSEINTNNDNNDKNAKLLTYSQWRKERIKCAMDVMKK